MIKDCFAWTWNLFPFPNPSITNGSSSERYVKPTRSPPGEHFHFLNSLLLPEKSVVSTAAPPSPFHTFFFSLCDIHGYHIYSQNQWNLWEWRLSFSSSASAMTFWASCPWPHFSQSCSPSSRVFIRGVPTRAFTGSRAGTSFVDGRQLHRFSGPWGLNALSAFEEITYGGEDLKSWYKCKIFRHKIQIIFTVS